MTGSLQVDTVSFFFKVILESNLLKTVLVLSTVEDARTLGQKLKASLHTCRMSHSGATPTPLLQIPDWYSSKLQLFTQLLSGKFKIIQGSRGWEWIVFGPLPVHHSFCPACLPIPNCLDLHSVPFAAVLLKRSSFDIHFWNTCYNYLIWVRCFCTS